jgi:hypothetical protein
MGQETWGNGIGGIGGAARMMVERAEWGTGAGSREPDGASTPRQGINLWGIFFSF